jgi:TRAP transporter 4TM/12TM fusion protein
VSDDQNLDGEVTVAHRELTAPHDRIVFWACIIVSCFHLWSNTLGVLPELQRNAIHYGFLLFIAYLMYPARRGQTGSLVLDYGLAILSAATALYLIFFEADLNERNQVLLSRDLIAAGLAILLLLEITRRTTGWFIPTLALLFLTYATLWGKFVGGMWRFPGVSFERILYRMYFAPDGIFGTIATVSSTFVALFVLFGAFLIRSGAGDFILRVALALLGRTVGGPAKMAVCASGLLGSISGSAVANTVGSGSLTIPMMKRTGFKPAFAAAVEASASTGGQLMPPIMGAGAFIMSQWTQIPYLTIVAVSFVPALMYFLSVIFFVHFRARRDGIATVDPSEVPKLSAVLKEGWHFTIPLAVLIGLLLVGFTPTYAAAVGTLSIIVASWLRPSTRMSATDILEALALGTRNLLSTGVILLCAGIIVGVVLLVGIGIKFSILIGAFAGTSVFLAVIMIAIASLILGMGLPVTASYIVLAVLAAPALTNLGVSLIAAHLLIFWYSQDANVTPPVCLAAYSAAGIAGSDPIQTGFASWKISKGLYLIPLLFCYSGILFQDGWLPGIQATVFATLGLLAFAAASEGFHAARLSTPLRFLYGLIGAALLYPNLITNLAGAALLLFLYLTQRKMSS